MTALPRLQQALIDARPRPRRAPRVLAGAAVAGAAVLAVASLSGQPDPERVATPAVPVEVGKPVAPEPAGDPPEGRIEMRATDPVSGKALVGLYFTYRGDPCWEVGPEQTYREYPVREGGSCFTGTGGKLPVPFAYGIGNAPGQSTSLDGTARDDVERLVLDGAAGHHEIPLAEHGGWFVALPPSFAGELTLTAHLRGGGRHTAHLRLPVELPPAPPPDPLEKELRARPADVTEIAVTPTVGGPDTTFELSVPPAEERGVYAISVAGPAGQDCRGELGETFGIVSDERGRVRPLPPHRQAPFMAVDEPGYDEALRRAPWCPGRYRVKVRRVEYREKGPGRLLARLEFEVR